MLCNPAGYDRPLVTACSWQGMIAWLTDNKCTAGQGGGQEIAAVCSAVHAINMQQYATGGYPSCGSHAARLQAGTIGPACTTPG